MTTATRSVRLSLRATPPQEAVLRRAAALSRKSMSDFIVDSTCLAAERNLLDLRLTMVTGASVNSVLTVRDRPALDNPGLADLFRRDVPWGR